VAAIIAAACASLVNLLVRFGLVTLFQVNDSLFKPLQPIKVVVLTWVGVFAAAGVLTWIGRRSERPARMFLKVALVALAISAVPNILILVFPQFPTTSLTTVSCLYVMHLTGAMVAIPVLLKFGVSRAS
jgi:hypothetical protein